ncbi:class I adenylate-forming enzyme family protein [Roseibium sp. RKSG952]|uniref:AMP-binding protein n=1 Tax=Roseibium sp. RKSG952 TaxID=2529384 RepID=UPI0018AD206F|nr:class I adenylate-forming enzyme family protein [Roseibium sp. RKSG952]
MKLAIPNLAGQFYKSGAWGNTTLNGLIKTTATRFPDRLAIADAPDRSNWTGGVPRQLTYAQADAEIDRIAALFRSAGLVADEIVGMQAPNSVDAVVTFLAALRAGLIVSPLPLHWRDDEVLHALGALDAKAFISADWIETRDSASSARNLAAELFGLRFVFGLGSNLPDGMICLGTMLEELGDGLACDFQEPDDPANHLTTICWSQSDPEPVPVTRTHNQWLSAGRAVCDAAGFEEGAVILLPYSLTGLTGIGAGLAPWLLTRGTLHLHYPTSVEQLGTHAITVDADWILSPGQLANALNRQLGSESGRIVAAHPVSHMRPQAHSETGSVIDLHVADEFGLVAASSCIQAALSEQSSMDHAEGNRHIHHSTHLEILVPPNAESTSRSSHPLLFRGPMVPQTGWNGTHRIAGLAVTDDGCLETALDLALQDGLFAGFSPGKPSDGLSGPRRVPEVA